MKKATTRTFSVTTLKGVKVSFTFEITAQGSYFYRENKRFSYFITRNRFNPIGKWALLKLDHKEQTRELLATAGTVHNLIYPLHCNVNYMSVRESMDYVPNYYKPVRAYEYDSEKGFLGRDLFVIRGELSDGTKCWYKCDEKGETTGTAWYSMTRKNGRLIAILEAVD